MKRVSAIALMAGLAVFIGGEGGGTPANATDLFGNDAGYAGPVRVNWSGFYIGGRVGYGNANHDLTVKEYRDGVEGRCVSENDDGSTSLTYGVIGDACTNAPDDDPAGLDGSALPATEAESFDLFNIDGINSHGFIGGAQIGFDKQLGSRLVIGIFGSYDFTNIKTTASITGLGAATLEKQDEWSLGGRVGYLMSPETMIYALAAYTETSYDINGIDLPAKIVDQDRRNLGANFGGVSVGGGIEHAINSNIFLGLEYQHTFYGDENIVDIYDAICDSGIRVVDDLDEDKVMATLKIKLNKGVFGY